MRLIDADALKKEMLETYEYEYPTASGAFDEFASRTVPNIISNAPTIDAEPVVHGRWIDESKLVEDADGDWFAEQYKCNICGRREYKKEPYCNCGAKMDEVSE